MRNSTYHFIHPYRHKYLYGLAIVVLVLLLAACGGRSSEPETDTTDVAANDAPTDDAATATQSSTDAAASLATPTPAEVAEDAAADDADQDNTAQEDASSGPVDSVTDLLPTERDGYYSEPPEMTIDPEKYYYATIKTEKGDIGVQLFAKRAPKTVNNFVFLAQEGFYNDTTFHRVLDGFMAQAGDPTGTGAGGPGYLFEDEFYPGLGFDQSGLLAMANRGPGTNGSQFFITFAPTDWLNNNHSIFGKVIEGDDVLANITRRDPGEQPDFEGDKILTIEIEETTESVLPPPTPAPPTATPTATPTSFAPSSMDPEGHPLADVPPAERANYFNTPPEMVIDPAQTYQATITTNKGDLLIDLFAEAAPTAVNNFVVLANLGFYDGTPISLVRPEDSIIFGVPDNNPINDAGYSFAAEIGSDVEIDIGAMMYIPLSQQPDGSILSSSSQILIALIQPPPQLTSQYSFFAQIVEGVDLLPQLTTADMIESITILEGE